MRQGKWYQCDGDDTIRLVLGPDALGYSTEGDGEGCGEPSCTCGGLEADGGVSADNAGGFAKVTIRYTKYDGGYGAELVVEEEARGDETLDIGVLAESVADAWKKVKTNL